MAITITAQVTDSLGATAIATGVVSIGSASSILPADRMTTWNPGLMAVGGIPNRTVVYKMLSPLGGGQDDVAQIQAAINACPLGQVVALAPATYTFTGGNFVVINKGVTLRGAGGGKTIFRKTNGSQMEPGQATGPNPGPAVILGLGPYGFWTNGGPDAAGGNVATNNSGGVNLTADAVHAASSVTVASASGFQVGQIVILDELSGAQWMPDVVPGNAAAGYRIWASPDYRVTWKKHNPVIAFVDDFAASEFPTQPNTFGDFIGTRLDRPNCEIKEILSISGNTITFTSPIHLSYRVSHAAQLTWYTNAPSTAYVPHVRGAGLEGVTMRGFDDGCVKFNWAAYCWATDIEQDVWVGQGFAFTAAFRCEMRRFYSHGSAWSQPMGGSYAICLDHGSSEILIEDGISVEADKVMVARRSGAGCVVGYCYTDKGFIDYNQSWIEVGLNGSHLVGCHHMLFEGNQGVNLDSDNTHGASIHHTFFRNWARGIRHSFVNPQNGQTVDDASQPANGPRRCGACQDYSYWMSFVGNVLGERGQMSGWVYETTFAGVPGIWMLGWATDHNGASSSDPQVSNPAFAGHAIRDGNFDWLNSKQTWHETPGGFAMPDSLYLTSKPAFFGTNPWPWVDPAIGATFVLPAKARFDAGTPNA